MRFVIRIFRLEQLDQKLLEYSHDCTETGQFFGLRLAEDSIV